MNRARILTALAIVLVGAWGCGRETATPAGDATATVGVATTQVEETITNLEQKWVAAILAKDTATIDQLLADDFVGTTNDRRYVKKQAVEDVVDGTHELLRLDDVQVRVYGDTAIVDIDQTEKSHHGTDDFSGTYLFTNVWVKRNGEWRAVASHGSRIR
jgi:ketosteroid isomerase-like protein